MVIGVGSLWRFLQIHSLFRRRHHTRLERRRDWRLTRLSGSDGPDESTSFLTFFNFILLWFSFDFIPAILTSWNNYAIKRLSCLSCIEGMQNCGVTTEIYSNVLKVCLRLFTFIPLQQDSFWLLYFCLFTDALLLLTFRWITIITSFPHPAIKRCTSAQLSVDFIRLPSDDTGALALAHHGLHRAAGGLRAQGTKVILGEHINPLCSPPEQH